MPIGIERLNARHQQPNSRITFIKPLPGPTSPFAQDFLERIAAITHPIMKTHHLSITTLEEHEPNSEFVGRNFNAGEVIQLVLRARNTHSTTNTNNTNNNIQWLSFRQVQMVMMHELAHCQQMNHSRAFWTVRDVLAAELRLLWGRGYTGDGFWGQGATLLSPRYEPPLTSLPPDLAPRNLCGGTFRTSTRRGGKRKRNGTGPGPAANAKKEKKKKTYAERERARVVKRFGTGGGTVLGGDQDVRVGLEGGRLVAGRPRVAGSVRGRELRAQAALARGGGEGGEEKGGKGGMGEEVENFKKEGGSEGVGKGGSSDEEEVVDEKGLRILDGGGRGRGMVRVCGGAGGGGGGGGGDNGEEGCGEEVKRERDEILGL